jgi:hypothetical protein
MAENWSETRLKEGKKGFKDFNFEGGLCIIYDMSCNARSRAPRGQIKAFVVVAVRSAMTSLRTAAEITRANFALTALLRLAACPNCSMRCNKRLGQ